VLSSVNVLATTICGARYRESSYDSLTFPKLLSCYENTRLMPVRSALFIQNVFFLKDDDVMVHCREAQNSFRSLRVLLRLEGRVIAVLLIGQRKNS